MKKLLTILLTLVMAIGLINVNNSQANAEDNPTDYPIYLGKNNSGVYGVYEDSTCTNTYKGAYASNITVSDTVNGVYVIENLDMTNPNGNCINVTANATIKYKGTNSITSDSTEMFGARTIVNSNSANITIQKYDNNDNSLTVENKGYASSAISMTGGSIIFEDGDVTLKHSSKAGLSIILENGSNLIVKDANIILDSNNNGLDIYNNLSNVSILDKGSILIKTNAVAISCAGEKLDLLSGYLIKASKEISGANATDGVFKYNDNTTRLYAGDDMAKYAYITKNVPVPPTPSPSEPVVKDESCEKVIGPTWHWNESKGICEEYATVGTSTRGIDSK